MWGLRLPVLFVGYLRGSLLGGDLVVILFGSYWFGGAVWSGGCLFWLRLVFVVAGVVMVVLFLFGVLNCLWVFGFVDFGGVVFGF